MSDIPGARGSCATRRWSGKAAIWGNLDLLAARVKRWFHKDGGQAMINVLGGYVDILYASPPSSMPMVKAGKLRAIAVTSATQLAVLPDAMTAKESGFPDFEVNAWYSVAAPANTAREVVAKLNAEIA